MFILDLEVDEIQTEKISIFSEEDIQPKLSHFFKNYGVNNPDFKKKIFQRVKRFFEYMKNQNLFDRPMFDSPDKGSQLAVIDLQESRTETATHSKEHVRGQRKEKS